ncbi:long-chain-fatty-acid--CoA ligase [Arvimicrobium flavum]|uniref:long-chain-fatty-acid--CoA ligase n=1 Tax=Arvimicrobium flavum TaxID=3393320 RepID=UPI00237A6753|nr:long-chain-fatty-acid--CoA ligase [Mesorhizobium shangrilense]
MLLTQPLRRMGQLAAKRLAVVDGAERRNWSQVNDRVARLAAGLGALGINVGDRVAILALNSSRYMEAYFGTLWAGAVAVPLNTRWSFEELAYGLTDSEPDVLFIDATFLPHLAGLRERWKGLKHVVFIGEPVAGSQELITYERLLADNAPVPAAPVPPEALAVICYTGGTTGLSKGVMLSHLAVWASSVALSIDYAHIASRDTIFLHAMPLFHSGGSAVLFATTIAGGTHVFLPGFNPTQILQTIQNEKITHTQLVPTMVRMLLDQPDFESYDVSSLQTLIYGGAPMSAAQIEETLAKLPRVNLQQGYGQTELAPYISSLRPEDHVTTGERAKRLRSAGYAGLCSEIMVCDPDGKELPAGEIGEVCVRGPHMMSGYWRKPNETAAAMVDGWIRTGDAGYLDEDGFVFLVDRIKDMIVTGGENVYSSEVENAIARHPAVATVAVIGIPSEKWGEAVHAVIILRKDQHATESEIIEHSRRHISGYKCPRSVEFRTEPLPLAGPGKILKRALRAPYWQAGQSRIA